jgi:putative aldouronate transport system substrate-binding protein
MAYYTGPLAELYENGVIVDIAQYLQYMPNFKALLDTHERFRKASYDDEGRILQFRQMMTEKELWWGGLVYRRDILDTMTGGNVAFPSGNEEPVTIEDWEYMLPLFKAYFQAANMADYAPLIIPYNGYFVLGELASGFGVGSSYYIDNKKVLFGPVEQGFYNYLVKMKEWYDAGYIYKDFASRVNDLFYLPNTALTYGGAAGIWFGLNNQVGDVMSVPEYGLYFDVRPIPSPVDTKTGITEAFPYGPPHPEDMGGGNWTITSKCKNIPRLVSALDFMYGDKGAMMRKLGLSVEDGAAEDTIYQSVGLTEGAYWFEGNTVVRNPKIADSSIDGGALSGERLPALGNTTYSNLAQRPEVQRAGKIWRKYDDSKRFEKLPTLTFSSSDGRTISDNTSQITDYVNEHVPKFIIGTVPLNQQTWNEYVSQIKALGIDENLKIYQEAYDKYLAR